MINFIIIALFIIIILVIIYLNIEKIFKIKTINTSIEEKNKDLINTYNKLQNNIDIANKELNEKNNFIQNMNAAAQDAFTEYHNSLDIAYNKAEREYDSAINVLNESYDKIQDNLLYKTELIRQDLDKISATRAAAIEAQRKEKIIKENKTQFSLNIDDTCKNDIKLLEKIKKDFSRPRVIGKIIWETYFRDYMTELCNDILGINIVCGIYKITNQITDECYIGQSVDVAKRWKDHVKCGLDIDRPFGNKLYEAMLEDEVWNFTFELLETCPREYLNEKEKFYINLYQSNKFGYNSQKGNEK